MRSRAGNLLRMFHWEDWPRSLSGAPPLSGLTADVTGRGYEAQRGLIVDFKLPGAPEGSLGGVTYDRSAELQCGSHGRIWGYDGSSYSLGCE